MKLTKNFNSSEFTSKDGAPFPPYVFEKIKALAENLQVLRDHFNLPIKINSGYRSPDHNKKIGGAVNSYHMKGMAADITIPGKTSAEIYAAITALIRAKKMKQGGLGYYPNFVHYDIRGWYSRW